MTKPGGNNGALSRRQEQTGLSTAHIPPFYKPDPVEIRLKPERAIAGFYKGASLGMVRRERFPGVQIGGGLRGRVGLFTRQSRMRLKRTVARIKNDCLPFFVTLTYPDSYKSFSEPERWKRDLEVFGKRLLRLYERAAFVWKLDMKDRQSGVFKGRILPHFHLLVYGIPYSSHKTFREWVTKAWFEVVGSDDLAHLRAGTQVARVRSHNGVMKYASKGMSHQLATELAKQSQGMADGVGRWWGVMFRENMPFGEYWEVLLTEQDAINLIRYFRRYAGLRSGRAYKSLSCFLDADWWAERLPQILYPDLCNCHQPGAPRSPVFRQRSKPCLE